MARVSVRPVETLIWQYGPEAADGGRRPGRCFHHPGTQSEPQLFEVSLAPGQRVEPHAHEKSEIIYILEGDLHLGETVLKPGSSVHVPGETLYGFAAGPDGVRFLNFRTAYDEGVLTVGEVKARRRRTPPG